MTLASSSSRDAETVSYSTDSSDAGLDARLALRELGERGLKLDLRSLEIGDGLGQDVELLGAHGVESTHGGLSLRELALEEFDALRHGG